MLLSRRLTAGASLDEAFCRTVSEFDGSVAIAVSAAARPDQLHLALRGSGQSLNVGFAEDAFIVASEAYGLVQETSSYLRMDGETNHTGGPGQVVVLDRAQRGRPGGRAPDGLRRLTPGGGAGRDPHGRDHHP